MLDDARDWKNSGKLGDKPHHKVARYLSPVTWSPFPCHASLCVLLASLTCHLASLTCHLGHHLPPDGGHRPARGGGQGLHQGDGPPHRGRL